VIRVPSSFNVKTRLLGTITARDTARIGLPVVAVIAYNYPGIELNLLLYIAAAFAIGAGWKFWKPRGRHTDQHITNLATGLINGTAGNDFTPEARGDIVRTGNGAVAAVIEVEPVNLDLKTRDQKKALHRIQEELLSEVNYPVKIHSEQISLGFENHF
jgi:hypothetical protein